MRKLDLQCPWNRGFEGTKKVKTLLRQCDDSVCASWDTWGRCSVPVVVNTSNWLSGSCTCKDDSAGEMEAKGEDAGCCSKQSSESSAKSCRSYSTGLGVSEIMTHFFKASLSITQLTARESRLWKGTVVVSPFFFHLVEIKVKLIALLCGMIDIFWQPRVKRSYQFLEMVALSVKKAIGYFLSFAVVATTRAVSRTLLDERNTQRQNIGDPAPTDANCLLVP